MDKLQISTHCDIDMLKMLINEQLLHEDVFYLFQLFDFVLWIGSSAVAGELQLSGSDHRWAQRQLQLSVDHLPTEQKQPDINAELKWGISHHRVLDCAKVYSD